MTAYTWRSLSERYLERLDERRPGSAYATNVRKVLNRFAAYLGAENRSVADMTDDDLQRYVSLRRSDTWHGRRLSVRTVNNELAMLVSVFAWAGPKTRRGDGRHNLGVIPMPPYLEPLTCHEEPR